MALWMWLGVFWVISAVAVILLFIGARRSQTVRQWLFGPAQTAVLHHLATQRSGPPAEPQVRQAA